MALGIRSKVIVALITSIVLPAAVTVGGFMYSTFRMQENAGDQQLEKTQQVNQIVIQEVIDSYSSINHGNTFYRNIKPLLEKYYLELQIINLNGDTSFDSNWFSKEGEPKSQAFLDRFIGDANKATIPIVINNNVAGNAVITSNDPAFTGFLAKLYSSMLISLAIGILTLISLVIIFTIYLSRSVLRPLKQLNGAAERISQGDLDRTIEYKAGDELGKFSRTFDQMRQKLKESLQKQQESERARKELLASISHDLRTPITSIKGYVEGLQDGVAKDEEMFDRYLQVIKDKTDKLDRLIDELFWFSRLDMDRVEINLQQINSHGLLTDIFGEYELELGQDQFIIKKPLPSVQVMVDKHKIAQVVDNLVQNARRHAGESVRINVMATIHGDRLVIEMNDNGPGISEYDLPHVFERFYRGEKSRSRDYGGTGLGLTICKYIIDAHGGDIWVESSCGKGSTFYFSLPILIVDDTLLQTNCC